MSRIATIRRNLAALLVRSDRNEPPLARSASPNVFAANVVRSGSILISTQHFTLMAVTLQRGNPFLSSGATEKERSEHIVVRRVDAARRPGMKTSIDVFVGDVLVNGNGSADVTERRNGEEPKQRRK